MADKALANIDRARRALAAARTVDDLLDLRDQMAAAGHWLQQIRASRDAQNDAAELRFRCERRLGELLVANPEYGRGRKSLKLSDFGIDRNEASRFKHLASIPPDRFERHLAEVKATGEELTAAGLERLFSELSRRGTDDHPPPTPPPKPKPSDWRSVPVSDVAEMTNETARVLRHCGVKSAGQLADRLDGGGLAALPEYVRAQLREAVAELRGYDREPEPAASPDEADADLRRSAWTIDLTRCRDKAGDLAAELDGLSRSPFAADLDRFPLVAAVAAQLRGLYEALNECRTWSLRPPEARPGGEPWETTG